MCMAHKPVVYSWVHTLKDTCAQGDVTRTSIAALFVTAKKKKKSELHANSQENTKVNCDIITQKNPIQPRK